MKNDFSETLKQIAETLAEQNAAWSRARSAFAELDASAMVSVDPAVLDDLEQACSTVRSASAAPIPSAFRA